MYCFHSVAGVDVGIKNPTAIRVHGCKFEDRWSHVVSEFYERGLTSPRVVDLCVETENHFPGVVFVVDPSAADLIQQLRDAGLHAQRGENDVLAGIRCVEALLANTDENGTPLLTMEPTCTKGNLEYPAYRWKEGEREQPVKEFDHAIDADRYARMHIARGKAEPFVTRRRAEDDIQVDRERDELDPRLWPKDDGDGGFGSVRAAERRLERSSRPLW